MKLPPHIPTDYEKVQMQISLIAGEIDRCNNYFKTVNSCFMALAQYARIPAKEVAKILADPARIANYENDVVLALKALSSKAAADIDKMTKTSNVENKVKPKI